MTSQNGSCASYIWNMKEIQKISNVVDETIKQHLINVKLARSLTQNDMRDARTNSLLETAYYMEKVFEFTQLCFQLEGCCRQMLARSRFCLKELLTWKLKDGTLLAAVVRTGILKLPCIKQN